jgi:hypothetical protein
MRTVRLLVVFLRKLGGVFAPRVRKGLRGEEDRDCRKAAHLEGGATPVAAAAADSEGGLRTTMVLDSSLSCSQ